MPANSDALTSSARNATFLVLIQISSRGFTFIINQIFLRYLSPSLLGISQQLELFTISVLYFSRESLRVALQRQVIDTESEGAGPNATRTSKDIDSVSSRIQEVVNLSYLSILFGPILAAFFAWLYLAKASPESLAVPCLRPSLYIFCFATVLELISEPFFAYVVQRQDFRQRAIVETGATLAKCIVTVGSAIWASHEGYTLGPLPFAFGQCAYAGCMLAGYQVYVMTHRQGNFSMLPKAIQSNTTHVLSLFPRQVLSLAASLYAQSGLKHILTQGDALLIAFFADLPSQGIFALASNYGSLLARMLFQPIEESSRSLFGRLLSSPVPTKSSDLNTKQNIPKEYLQTVHTYLIIILRSYSYLAIILMILAPPVSGPLLSIVAGRAWRATSAPQILAKYCFYLPLLAYNGLLEAFVSATASPAELQKQSMAMLVFSGVFAAAGYILLGILNRGVDGILEANVCNMAVRILWSRAWVEWWWAQAREQHASAGKSPDVPTLHIFCAETLPHPVTLAIAAGTQAVLWQFSPAMGSSLRNLLGVSSTDGLMATLVDISVIAATGIPMLCSIAWYEWDNFVGPVVQKASALMDVKFPKGTKDQGEKVI